MRKEWRILLVIMFICTLIAGVYAPLTRGRESIDRKGIVKKTGGPLEELPVLSLPEGTRKNATYLNVSEGTVTLHSDDSGDYTGIWVYGTGMLILNGCKVDLIDGTDGHHGEFNITGQGTIHIIGGSEITIGMGNFSARGKEFKMENSKMTVTNITGGEAGDPSGTGTELNGRPGSASVVDLVTRQSIVIKNSEIYCYGKTGGLGAAGINEEKMNGGHGGVGGAARVKIIAPRVDICDDTIIRCRGGRGGQGGERVPTQTTAKGGDGGVGGQGTVFIEAEDFVSIKDSEINGTGGMGGDASRTSGDELYGKGGWGGDTDVYVYAAQKIEFEDCVIYALSGDRGLGGDRNVDGMPGRDELTLKTQYKSLTSITGKDSVIRITKDRFGIDNPMGASELDNVSAMNREGEAIIPYAVGETKITIKWNIMVTVIDDYTKRGMPGADVVVKIRNADNEMQTIKEGTTDANGVVFFESILSRTIHGNNLGKFETVWITASKYTYKGDDNWPLDSNLRVTIPINILSLWITDVSYRSVLVDDARLDHVPVSKVGKGEQKLGGVVYINGSAKLQSSSPDEHITEISVIIGEGTKEQVDDISEGQDWTRWSYRLETSKRLSGSGKTTKLKHLFDKETFDLEFAAYETKGFTTAASISISIDQDWVNNPPYCGITGIGDTKYEEKSDPEKKVIFVPPPKQMLITIEGDTFDLDGDKITKEDLMVYLEGPSGTTRISRDDNTEVNDEEDTWTVNWLLDTRTFNAGDYFVYVDVSDGNLNMSDSDHFGIRKIPITIKQETRPGFEWFTISGCGKTFNNNITDIEFEDETRLTFSAKADTDAHAQLMRFKIIITDKHTLKPIEEKTVDSMAGGKFTYNFKFDLPAEEDREYTIAITAVDDRGYSGDVDCEIRIKYVPGDEDITGLLFDVNLPGIIEVGDTMFIFLLLAYAACAALIFLQSSTVKNKIEKRNEAAQKKTKIQRARKIKSLAEIEGQSKDNVMYVPGGVGKEDYSTSSQGYYSGLAQGGGYQPEESYSQAPQTPPEVRSQPPFQADSLLTKPQIVTQPSPAPQFQTTAPVMTAPSSQPVNTPVTTPTTQPVTTAPITQPVTTTALTTSPVTRPMMKPTVVTTPAPTTTQTVTTTPTTQPMTRPVTTAPMTQPVTTAPVTQPVARGGGKTCPKCGSPVNEGWFICPKCKGML